MSRVNKAQFDQEVALRGSLEKYRIYLAGECTQECIDHGQIESLDEPYNGHRHWTDRYEDSRCEIVNLNYILTGEYDYPASLRRLNR